MGSLILNWIEKAKELFRPKNEYVTLTPDDNITNGTEYLNALKWAIKNKKAKNIALSGPYGSGKSSVIETFLRKNRRIKERSIKISMATFTEETKDEKGEPKKQIVEIKKDEIERSILKQLFYKVNYKQIPQSRYRKLHVINFWPVFLSVILFVIACLIISYIFWPSALVFIIDKIFIAGAKVNLSKKYSAILALVFFIVIISVLSKLSLPLFSKYKIKDIKFPHDFSIERLPENQDTIFNKNMDEIVYFFEETKYNIIFFEDFDRLQNPSLFIHLRELNIILNNCDSIKKPIIFIYAIKEDFFTEEDRTKFFDFIIPIVPIINSTNSGEILLQKLENSKQIEKEHKISESFITDVSPFISDMRILQNIYNEFVIYKSTLKTGQDLKLLDEPMLALIIFKNLYPSDFADLQMEKGVVKQAFYDKETFISNKQKELQKRIAESTDVLDRIKTEFFNTRKTLKCSFLYEITNCTAIAYYFTPDKNNSVRAENFLDDNYDIPNWSGVKNCSGKCTYIGGGSGYSFGCSNFDEIYDTFIQNYKAVKLIEDNKVEEEKDSVQTMRQQIRQLSSKSLFELINSYGLDDILSENVKKNKFLVFLLRRGYVDENYVDYINYFKATSITTGDMNYILDIKNLSPKPFDYKLSRTDLVVKRLQPYEFEQDAIYNFDLLEFLLSSNNHNEKLHLFVKQLSNGNDISWKFIEEFIDITNYKGRFINLLTNIWDTMWDAIFHNSVLTKDRKFHYLSMIVSYSSLKSIKAMDAEGNLTDFFVTNNNVLQQLSSVQDEKIIDTISTLGIKFNDIQVETVSARILDYIFDNNLYTINFEMIQHIVEYKNKELVPFLEKKNYSTLLKLNYAPLLKYIDDNIDVYIDEVFLYGTNTEEEINAIVRLLELNVNSKCRYTQIIGHEDFYVNDITTICAHLLDEHEDYVNDVWDAIIRNEKLKPTWNNFINYWFNFGHTDISISYMCKNVDALSKEDSSCIDDNRFIKELITSNIDQDCFAKLLPKLPWKDFDIELNTLDKSKVSTMISQKYFDFTIGRYNELETDFPDLCVEFIINNQSKYMEYTDQITMDSELLETLVFDQRFTRANAQSLMEDYASEHMTIKIASNLNILKIKVNTNIFDSAWNFLNVKQKERLLLDNIDILDADKFEKVFSDLEEPYIKFADRKWRHEVHLYDTEANLRLVKRLEKINYVTGFNYKEKMRLDSEQNKVVPYKVIACRVKATSK